MLMQRLKTWWAVRDGIARLDRLDDRLLRDLGLTRRDIPARVRHGYPPSASDGDA